MKIKKLLLMVLMALTLLTAVGCGSKTETTAESTAPEASSEQVTVHEGRPQLVGKIKDVVGNEVTIYKAEINTEAQRLSKPNDTTESEENPAKAENSRSAQSRQMTMKFNEETETFIIPVGTPIVTAQRGGGSPQIMQITDLKAEQVLMIWQQEDAITFVQVMGGNKTNQNNGQNQENRQVPANGVPGSGQMGGGRRQ